MTAVLLLQLIFGTFVRAEVDLLLHSGGISKEILFEKMPNIFFIHRSFSWVVLGLCLYYSYKLYSTVKFRFLSKIIIAFIGISFVSGVLLYKFGLPAFAQPIHLLNATILIGIFVSLLLRSGVMLTKSKQRGLNS